MNKKIAEEILCDEIEINSAVKFFSVIEDLQKLIQQGLIRQVSGSVSINHVKELPALENINMQFETVPGKTEYHLGYHGGGVFFKGSSEEYKRKYWEEFFSKRMNQK